MSKVIIDYSEIRSASKQASKAASEFEDYAEAINKKVSKKLSGLSGTDSAYNISNANSMLSNKMRELRKKKEKYETISSNLAKLADSAETHEKNVVTGMRSIAESALDLKKQSKWKKFTQWVYGTFCVDLMNWNPVTRCIGNLIRKGNDWVRNTGAKIYEYFKYGDGRYILKIALDVLTVTVAIVGTVLAIALAVASGGAVLLVLAAVFTTIGTIMTMVDSGFSIANNVKAYKIHKKEGDPGKARYYGNIDGVSGYIERTDLGDEEDNKFWANFGKAYDVTHTVVDIAATVTGFAGSAGLTGKTVYDPKKGKYILETTYDKKVIFKNMKNMTMENLCFKKNPDGKWTFNIKNLFKVDKAGTKNKIGVYKKDIIGDLIGDKKYKFLKTIDDFASTPGKIISNGKNLEIIFKTPSVSEDRIQSIYKVVTQFKPRIISPIKTYGDFFNDIHKIREKLK